MFCLGFAHTQSLTQSRCILFPPAIQNQAPPGTKVSDLCDRLPASQPWSACFRCSHALSAITAQFESVLSKNPAGTNPRIRREIASKKIPEKTICQLKPHSG